MDKKITNIKERVLYIAEIKGVSKERFFEELGLSYANFKGKQKNSALNSDAVDKILTKYKDISADWLVLDKGAVIRENAKSNQIISNEKDDYRDKYMDLLEKNMELHEENKRLTELVTSTATITFPKQQAYAVAEDDPNGLVRPKKKLKKSKD